MKQILKTKKILYCGYREWSDKIFHYLKNEFGDKISFEQVINKDDFNRIDNFSDFDMIFFVGWSWIIKEEIVKNNICLCLHPSPLPKYRGGSPIQNQIMNGEKESAVSVFVMDEGLDSGPIVSQIPFSLSGELDDILEAIVVAGSQAFREIIGNHLINNELAASAQDESLATICKRRSPEMSEIFIDDFKASSAEYLYNKIRALQDPYPNAFIRCGDGKKLYLIKAKIE